MPSNNNNWKLAALNENRTIIKTFCHNCELIYIHLGSLDTTTKERKKSNLRKPTHAHANHS